MNSSLLSFRFFKLSFLLILILTSLCATCDDTLEVYNVRVTASANNFDPVHIELATFPEFRLAPGEANTIRVAIEDKYERKEIATVNLTLRRMSTVVHTAYVSLNANATTNISIQETSYGSFSVDYSWD